MDPHPGAAPSAPSSDTSATAAAPPESYTILRVKRKRNEEPLDALVFDSQNRKRTKSAGKGGAPSAPGSSDGAPGVSVFTFAETVEEKAWADHAARARLQARITALARESSNQDQDRAQAGSPTQAEQVASTAPSSSTSNTRRVVPGHPHFKQPAGNPSERQARDASALAKQRRYTIVAHDKPQPDVSTVRFPTEPPKVLSAKDLEAAKSRFNMYDAILSPDAPRPAPSPPVIDSEMENFLPMLQDYLKINEISLAASAPPLAPSSSKAASRNKAAPRSGADEQDDETRIGAEGDEDDYVWDVFYYRPTLNAWDAEVLRNFGSLTGLPPSVNNPDDSDSDSEPEDEDDEDSNAEDYYKNDYPDEDEDWSDDGDEFHEDSDYDDFLRDDEDHPDWR